MIGSILRNCSTNSGRIILAPITKHLLRLFGGTASSLALTIFVADNAEGELVGFVEVGLRSHANHCDPTQPVGFIEGWYVVEKLRRQGIGRKLVAAAENWARSQGCKEMASDTPCDNDLSERAHESLGYTIVGRNTDFTKRL
jgi:aminoglycoside 6'-N-acetyltransferase I